MLQAVRGHRIISLLLILMAASLLGGSPETARSTIRTQSTLPDGAIVPLQEAFRGQVQSQGLVGAAAAVIIDGKVSLLLGEGLADRPSSSPVDPRKTLFRWASISKPLTAVVAMQLYEQDRLDLDGDVRGWVPEFPDKDVVISPRHLLGHLGGIVHYRNGPVIRTWRDDLATHPFQDVIAALDTFKESPLVNTPGEAFAYSTHGFILLSGVVQRAGDQRFADQVDVRIATPLGMATLQPDYQWVAIPNRATGYRKQGEEVVPSHDADVSWKLGGGGFLSSVADLGAFAAGLLQGTLLKADTQNLMWTPQTTADGEETGYGLGFGIGERQGRQTVSHSGAQEKTRTYMLLFPKENSGVVVMTNSEWGNPGAIARSLADVMMPSQTRPSPALRPTSP